MLSGKLNSVSFKILSLLNQLLLLCTQTGRESGSCIPSPSQEMMEPFTREGWKAGAPAPNQTQLLAPHPGVHAALSTEPPRDGFDPRPVPPEGYKETPTSALALVTQAVCPLTPAHLTSRLGAEVRVKGVFGSSPGTPPVPRAAPLLLRHRGSERCRSAEQLAILQFPLVTKLHMFRKLNLCRRLVVPSQKIRSDLYIALHKFLVNLYNHLERESLLAPQRAAAASAADTAGLPEAVPGTARAENTSVGCPGCPAWGESHPRATPFPRGRGLLFLPSASPFKNRQLLNARLLSLRRQPLA